MNKNFLENKLLPFCFKCNFRRKDINRKTVGCKWIISFFSFPQCVPFKVSPFLLHSEKVISSTNVVLVFQICVIFKDHKQKKWKTLSLILLVEIRIFFSYICSIIVFSFFYCDVKVFLTNFSFLFLESPYVKNVAIVTIFYYDYIVFVFQFTSSRRSTTWSVKRNISIPKMSHHVKIDVFMYLNICLCSVNKLFSCHFYNTEK